MTIAILDCGATFRALSNDLLIQNGISMTVGTDFEAYAEVIRAERPAQMLGLPFEPEVISRQKDDAFWMIARGPEGELVHTQAAKIVKMGNKSFGRFMIKGFRDFPPPLPDLDPDKSRFRPVPGARRIKGRVVYHGDVWMGGSPGQYRGSGLSSVLARISLAEIMTKWQPDYIFGLMARTVAFKGFAERMGYMHNEPGAVRWYRRGHPAALEGFLSYLSREDTEYLLSIPLSDLVATPLAA